VKPRVLPLSRRARRIEVSPTVAMFQRASALKARGEAVLDFSVGEPDQTTPARIAEQAARAATTGHTRYTPAAGIPELRRAVAERYREDFGVTFAPDEVAVTNGGKHALYSVCQCLLDPGDEVIVPAPYWPTFTEAVRLAGGRPVVASTREKDGFRIDAARLRRAVSDKTRAVIVNSPSNPTGSVVRPDDLLGIGRLAKRHGFAVLYDDTYAGLTFDGTRQPLQELRDLLGERLVILGTASKSYCMTGWRIGWVLAGKALIDACVALISHSTQCPTSFAQIGALEALRGPQGFVRELLGEYRRRRDAIHAAIAEIPGITCLLPQGSFYLFPNVKRYLNGEARTSLELSFRLLEEKRVAVVPGEGFGAPGYLRMSFARSLDELQEGARRIRDLLAEVGVSK
jgi:aspartate aminotransferase